MAVSKHHAFDDALVKAKARSKHWEREAKAGVEKVASVGKERNEAKEEAQQAQIAIVAAGDVKAWAEVELARVQGALAVAKEARRKVEVEAAHLEVKRTSLMLEIRAAKDEVSFLHSQASKDKEAMEEDYQEALELIFAYGYGCCMFKHNICGDQLEVPDGMLDSSDPLPLEFFINPKCPPALAPIEVTATAADQRRLRNSKKSLSQIRVDFSLILNDFFKLL